MVLTVSFALAIASLTIESVRISKYPYPLERKMQAFMISIAASTVLVKLIVYKKNDVPKMFEEILIIEKDMALNKNKEMQRIYVENLNTAIKYVILYEFLINSVNVASIAFQLITVSDYTKLIFAVIFFCLQVNQIFIIAITANEIQVQSVAVATNAYNSNWYEEYNKEIRQMMSMIILRAQKPAELTIGPFTPMTTDTAITVMKAAYSYVTLMVDSLGKK
ncbi:odorant receptor Or2-like [Sitophilus oryzae]|uniref:Odorant receptor Or2-like n=1 Tax=Sitophilus oryzae TaxID=7048 RepID=A0A6J2XI61_SITOR|nr:odorant receptor Or2-like [Sitophilus oryzae]